MKSVKEVATETKILDRLKTDLNNNGYKVNIRGPFYGLDVYWEIRVSWEEWGKIKKWAKMKLITNKNTMI